MSEKRLKTDVLVVGGGFSGCFAAVTARENGAEVILAEKNYCGKSGCSHFARDFMLFKEEWGDNFGEWMEQFSKIGEYIADQRWDELIIRESYDRYRDLVSWGVPFYIKDGSSNVPDAYGFPPPEEEPFRYKLRSTKYRKTSVVTKYAVRHKMMICRKKVLSVGASILDRTMITDLLKKDGRVVGAAGFNTQTGDYYIIEAKAVVIASGLLSFRPAYYGVWSSNGEGITMGYRAGADLSGMEFGAGMYVCSECDSVCIDGPVSDITGIRDVVTNGRGEEFLDVGPHLPINILWPIEVHKGNGPIYHDAYGVDRNKFKKELDKYNETAEGPWIEMLDRAGIDIFNDRFEQYMSFIGSMFAGGLRVNYSCETTVPGLYAAGDASGTNFTGPTYASLGSGMCGACVTGHRAGLNAARFAHGSEQLEAEPNDLAALKERILNPLERKSGFRPDRVLMRIQQTIFPYEVRMVMHEKRLTAALTMFEFFRDHFIPMLNAADSHELRLAHEVRSMVTGAEIMLRSALFRTESRGWFFREDYPRRDDKNWLKWVLVSQGENGRMNLRTEDVPKEYQGDLTLPYQERYPVTYGYGKGGTI
ncbi:MAG: FAD-binding protein [Synergistaceae bacterium]|nr:FAD-binding protein [Synergistaceae bacterium]